MALPSDRHRRGFVGSVAALLGASLAGCTSRSLGDAYSSPPEDTPISRDCEREHQELPDLWVRNRDSETRTVTVRVTGATEDRTSDPVFEETYDVVPETRVTEAVAFDPDAEDVERYDGFVATASTDDGQTVSEDVTKSVVEYPLRYGLRVSVDADGELTAMELHWDYDGETTPAC